MEINEALARLEIQSVLWTYARGVDRSDYAAMSSVYHREATDEHGSFHGPGLEFARNLTDRERDVVAVGQHHITNVVIEMDGDSNARVESYFLAFHPHQDGDATKLGIAAGRYLDHFQRRDGSWKIRNRRVVMDWTRDHVEGGPWPVADGKPYQGARQAQSDKSYEFFSERAPMDEAHALLQRYIKAQEDGDLETLVSCWHPDVETVHPLRPDRSWKGRESYRRFWTRQWAGRRRGRNRILTAEVVGNRIFLEGVTEHEDGTLVPNMNILDVEDGMIRRARVYTDVPRSDGMSMDDFVNGMNPENGD